MIITNMWFGRFLIWQFDVENCKHQTDTISMTNALIHYCTI